MACSQEKPVRVWGKKQDGAEERDKQRYIFRVNLASACPYREFWIINCITEFFLPWSKEPECLHLHISKTMTQDQFGKWRHIFQGFWEWSKSLEKWMWAVAANPTAPRGWLDWLGKGNLDVAPPTPLIKHHVFFSQSNFLYLNGIARLQDIHIIDLIGPWKFFHKIGIW